MLSLLFWIALITLFLGVKWIADGFWQLANVRILVRRPERKPTRTTPQRQREVAVFETAA